VKTPQSKGSLIRTFPKLTLRNPLIIIPGKTIPKIRGTHLWEKKEWKGSRNFNFGKKIWE